MELKNIDKAYLEWCGDHHTNNSNRKVHDSAECQDFARQYYNENIENLQLENIRLRKESKGLNASRDIFIALLVVFAWVACVKEIIGFIKYYIELIS